MGEDSADGCMPSKMETESDIVQASQPEEEEMSSQQTQDADTQPLDSQEMFPSSQGLEEEEGVYGYLLPHCGTFPRINLSTDSYKIGRTTGDYVVQLSDMGDERLYNSVSSTQCEIIKTDVGVFLKDFSTNGTWVNSHKVGKNNTYPLEQYDTISFCTPLKKVFVFFSNEKPKEEFPEELTSRYLLSKVLGTGATAEVRLAFKFPDLERVAIKIIKKSPDNNFTTYKGPSEKQLKNEIKILRAVNHPNIIKLEEIIDCEDVLYIVMEFAEGGPLINLMEEQERLDEAKAKIYFHQLVSAVEYLHSLNICHRDIKLENILISYEDEKNPVLKLTDMGLGKFADESLLKTICGTRSYLAPEVVRSAVEQDRTPYTVKVDCWALGVILYELLSGRPPFSEELNKKQNLRDQILTANFKFPRPAFDTISINAKNLISNLLITDPEERLSAGQILSHKWLKGVGVVPTVTSPTVDKGKKRAADDMDLDGTFDFGGEKKKKMNG